MDSALKDVIKQSIKSETNDYNATLTMFDKLVENGFDKTSTKVECQMLNLLSQMIWIKDEIRELETTLMLGEEETKC